MNAPGGPTTPDEIAAAPPSPSPRLQRARGAAVVTFKHRDGTTRLDRLFQDGCCKIRLPRVHDGEPVAVLLNTAGGVTGGDRLSYEVGWGDGACATATTQAAERIYRRSEGLGRIENTLTVGAGARALWLPQETIVFDRAGLDRSLDIDLAHDAALTAVESVVLGRTAMGESVREATILDRWRLRRTGPDGKSRLVYADNFRLVGDSRDILKGAATGRGAAAYATLVHAAPDAEGRLDELRALVETAGNTLLDAGTTAFDGLLVARFLATDGRALRDCLISVLENFSGKTVPRVWHC
ncbi:Urease accessory protein UreD [Hartmannibacter diazotrophicus]|uniref:Urease accessory protein UreD n=1 Tax=Hartmannibacter diazotrophicus TaxID=1482074 RepID=A0A2C9DCR3_9HYPH|nr:urease accessory protein UreD [Hartmannibacter diazotrophicus]SON57918.1 Urease accessory protein UreD [Hartmannibacter diazotrophicus]